MKKVLFILASILFFSLSTRADDHSIYKGIMCISSSRSDMDFKTVDGISGILNYSLELYTDGVNKQYSLCLSFDQSKEFLMMPTNCIVLLKTGKDEVIELHSLLSYDETDGDRLGNTYFPISQEQMDKIVNDGIKKFRIQIIAKSNHHSTIGEKEWKRKRDYDQPGTLGIELRVKYKSINRTWERNKKEFQKEKDKYNASQADITTGF